MAQILEFKRAEAAIPDIEALPIPRFGIGQKIRCYFEGCDDGDFWWSEFKGIVAGLIYVTDKREYRYLMSAYQYSGSIGVKVQYPYEVELDSHEGELWTY